MQQRSELPEGWTLTSVGALFKIVSGGTPSTKMQEYWVGDIPWISSADIHGLKDIRPRKTVSEIGIKQSATNLVPEKSIIVVTRVGLGKVCITDYPLCFSQDSQALIGYGKNILPEYILYYLSEAVKEFKYNNRGTTIVGVPKKQLAEVQIPLPPLAEQHRIVAAIEALFARLDATEGRLARVPEIMKQFRQSVLAAACEGRLTEDWRERNSNVTDETKRLSNIQDELRLSTKSRKNPSPNDHSKQYSLPKNWIWTHLGYIARIDTGSTPYRKNSTFWENGTIPWVTSGLLQKDFIIKPSEYVTEAALKQTRLKIFPKNTLLIALYGEGNTRGKSAELLIEATINQACASINFTDSGIHFKNYIKIYLKNIYEEIRKQSSGGVQPNLNLSKIKAMPIPLPPLPELEEIVRRVDALLAFADQIEARLTATQERTGQLRQSILEQAFSGRLVGREVEM